MAVAMEAPICTNGQHAEQPLACCVLKTCSECDRKKVKYPVNIMIFGAITSDGDVMPPFIYFTALNLIRKAIWNAGRS